MDISKFKEKYTDNKGDFHDNFQTTIKLLPFITNISTEAYDETCGFNGVVGGFFRNLSHDKVEPIKNSHKDVVDRVGEYLREQSKMSEEKINKLKSVVENILCPDGNFRAIDSSFLKYYPFRYIGEGKEGKKDKYVKGQAKFADYISCMMDDFLDDEKIKGRNDLFTQIVKRALSPSVPNEKDQPSGEHYDILPFVKEQFKHDFKWLLEKQDAVLIKYIGIFIYFYECYSILQTLLHIGPKHCDGENDGKAIRLYNILNAEKTSMKSEAVTCGWESKLGKSDIEKTFANVQALDILNILTGAKSGFYGEVMARLREEPLNQNKEACEDVLKFYKIQKRDHVNSRRTSKKKDSNIPLTVESYDDFVKKLGILCRDLQDDNYNRLKKRIYDLFTIRFLSLRRGKYILAIDNEMLIFLIAMFTQERKTKLKDMYARFLEYGIVFNMNTKRRIEQYLLKLNLLERKSDSGEAQYVRVIL